MVNTDTLRITPQLLSLLSELDEFKGAWRALGILAPERLSALRRIATIESIGSSTRIEGSRLTDREVEALLGGQRLGIGKQLVVNIQRRFHRLIVQNSVLKLQMRAKKLGRLASPTARREAGYCQFCPEAQGSLQRTTVPRWGSDLVTPTQLSPALISV